MKNIPLKICNEVIHPGERLSLALPLPELFSCVPMYMPIKVVHGRQQGPCILIIAARHGNELNGTEIINRLLNTASLKRLKGTIIAIPVLNVYGLINRSRYLPGGQELDQCFPGSKTGSHGARLAHIFTQQIFSKANYCIDLQTGPLNHSNVPQVFIETSNADNIMLAKTFAAPVISNVQMKPGSLRETAEKMNIPLLVYEAGEAMRFDEYAIKMGLQGIINVLKKLEMLPTKPIQREKVTKSFVTEGSIRVRAASSGISHSQIKLGQHVQKGDVLAVIKDPFGARDGTTITSPEEGIVVEMNNLPLVHEGEALFQLAVFSEPVFEKAADHLEDWDEKSQQTLENSD